ncbi:hypothetical protein [Flavobacterium sp.]|jgi:hypothetical protein|uniref:hypothetical protein n=1 Tax=Flavobacterium sp. TaxID=239 RepID=UPI0037C02D02
MEYLFIQRAGDKEKIACLLNEYRHLSKLDLVAQYNQAQKIGIVGAHAQAQRLVALHLAFTAVFETSPIIIENQNIIRLTGAIELENDIWGFKK